jgi:hypothetical protein
MKNLSLALLAVILSVITISGAIAKEVQVKGYTKKDGTVVKGYSKNVKDKDADTVQVKGYTKKDGTVVKGYARKKPHPASTSVAPAAGATTTK